MKNLIFIISIVMFLSACEYREDVFSNVETNVTFQKSKIFNMPKLRNSDKRGFSDLNCDGVDDMIEINDESSFFTTKEDYKIHYFEGVLINEQNGKTIKYKDPKIISIKIDLTGYNEAFKIDTADINGDSCADIVFTSVQTDGSKTFLNIKTAFNLGDLTFLTEQKKIKLNFDGAHDFNYWFNDLVQDISYDEESSLSDYLKMDWADFDGNGTDDLALFIDDGQNLEVAIFHTLENEVFTMIFESLSENYINNFLYDTSVKTIDTGDLNADGLSDIVVRTSSFGDYIGLGIALNSGDGFVLSQDQKLNFGVKTDVFGTSKMDLFDNNGDGKNDLIYITEVDDALVKIVFESI